jgi:hypothetical protein
MVDIKKNVEEKDDKVAETTGIRSSDNELELYRSLMEPAKEYKNGFTWTAVAGAIFCGLLMMPASIFLSLITGGAINASWVTVIIFSEITRRALKTLDTQELVILLYVAGAMATGGPIGQLIFRQYFISSDAVRNAGLVGQFPSWWAPPPGSDALLQRNLLHADWLIPISIIVLMTIISKISGYTLSYFLFRVTSDIEKLPFPFAPISAQGAMAMSESHEKKATWKWKAFSIGAIVGLAFAAVQIGVPMISGAFLAKPIQIIPMPWFDATTITQGFLPATPTGVVIDLGLVLLGMIIPFWAVMGTFAAVIITTVMNPILHNMGILHRWSPGMDTISTTYANSVDFWMSFGIGVAAAVAVVAIFQTVRDVLKKTKEIRATRAASKSITATKENIWDVPAGRGDFSPAIAVVLYAVCSLALTYLCHRLVPEFPIIFLLFFTLLYTPFISYVNAKLIGICGQQVEIPFIREGAYILSGVKGVNIWLAPIPVDNYGAGVQQFRVNELTGTNFWSYVKADILIIPLSLLLSLVFWAFIWHAMPIPSEQFPFVQKMWDLQAKNAILVWSSTLDTGGAVPMFYQALHPKVIASSFSFTVIAYSLLSAFGLPVMAIYGFIRGIGGMPHMFIFEFAGALIGKYILQKKFGEKRFLQMIPVVFAGYGAGVGLIALLGVAVLLIKNAISAAPF